MNNEKINKLNKVLVCCGTNFRLSCLEWGNHIVFTPKRPEFRDFASI